MMTFTNVGKINVPDTDFGFPHIYRLDDDILKSLDLNQEEYENYRYLLARYPLGNDNPVFVEKGFICKHKTEIISDTGSSIDALIDRCKKEYYEFLLSKISDIMENSDIVFVSSESKDVK